MSGIFGIFRLDGGFVDHGCLNVMRLAMAEWGAGGEDTLLAGPAGIGRMRMFSSTGSWRESLPLEDSARGIVFTAAGRVDNRDELIRLSGTRSQESRVSDGEAIWEAYLKWGENCPARIYGDWAFAAWHPGERKLFLARDHFGNTSLYYYADAHVFAFASSRRAILALGLAPTEMDELYLAQVMVSWPAYQGERTILKSLKRLPPAHCLTVTPERMALRHYWRLEETPGLCLPGREQYAEAFREVFDGAVRCRLRAGSGVAISLSGGLDSGAVAATAAKLMEREGRRLSAFTSTPLWNTGNFVGQRFGDEFHLARATADFAGNMDLHRVTAETITPIQAIRDMLTIIGEPVRGAGNFFWGLALNKTAADHGCRTLLTGQMGNAGISWTGTPISQSVFFQLRHFGWLRWAKEMVKRYAPLSLMKSWRSHRIYSAELWKNSAIHPEFAKRLNLLELYLNDPGIYPRTPLELRHSIVKPGRSLMGFLYAEVGAALGVEARDPTADARVLAFTFSVPDHIFIDPKTGMDRWLIREAMKGRLPDEVRLNRKRGRQAGDLVPRLRACAGEVEGALDELASGPAAEYVNLPYMRQVWRMVQTDDTPEAFHKSVSVLTRGIMAGLWVNGFYSASRF